MGGRVQNAAIAAAVMALGAVAHAHEPTGLAALRAAALARGSLVQLSGADAAARWSVTADVAKQPWDATATRRDPFFARIPAGLRDALAPEALDASLALDWRRRLAGGYLTLGTQASGRELHQPSTVSERDRRTRVGAATTWSGLLPAGGFGTASAFARSETADSRLALEPGPAPTTLLERSRLAQTVAGFETTLRASPARVLELAAGMRVEHLAFGLEDDGRRAGSHRLVSPSLRMRFALPQGHEAFAGWRRGLLPGGASVAFDPASGRGLPHLDPLADAELGEAGVASRWRGGLDTRLAFWRARTTSDIALDRLEAARWTDRETLRHGLHLAASYPLAPWLTLDASATAIRARIEGDRRHANERHATAGASVRAMRGWTASLHVRHFGPVRLQDEDGLRLRSSTTVGAQLTGKLSKRTRVSFEAFNLFDQRGGEIDWFSASRAWAQPGAMESYLSHPAEPRGFRFRVRTTF